MNDAHDGSKRGGASGTRRVAAGRSARASPERAVRPPRPQLARRTAPGAGGEGGLLTVPRCIALTGKIGRCEKLIVEGTVETDLEGCRELEVARTGTFIGDVDVEVADVAGILEGTLIARELLLLRAGGSVRGDIAYGEIVVERGAAIVGEMRPLSEERPPDADGSSAR